MEQIVKITEQEGKQLVSARDIHDFLGSKERFSKWFSRKEIDLFKIDVDYFHDTKHIYVNNGGDILVDDFFISLEMAKFILLQVRHNNKSSELLKQLDKTIVVHHTSSRFEESFGDMLIKICNTFNIEILKQFIVNKYRIDFYIPKYKIAIEYDEMHHDSMNAILKDKFREEYLRQKLKCKFVRLSYLKSDIDNTLIVLKTILRTK